MPETILGVDNVLKNVHRRQLSMFWRRYGLAWLPWIAPTGLLPPNLAIFVERLKCMDSVSLLGLGE